MNPNALIVGLSLLSLAGTGFLVATRPAHDADRVAELEAKLAETERRAADVASLRVELRELEARIARKLDGVGARSVATAEAPPVAAAPGEAVAAASSEAAASGKGLDELVADRVEKRMAERLDAMAARDRERGDDGKWKAPIDALAKELTLTEAQRADAKQVFDRAKDDGYVLLKTQRLDGGSLLDDFVGTLKSGADPAVATRQFFARIVSEKVPGSDRTYLAEFLGMNEDVKDQLSRKLDAAQMKRLAGLNVSLLEVQTGYDPVGDYVRARLQ